MLLNSSVNVKIVPFSFSFSSEVSVKELGSRVKILNVL